MGKQEISEIDSFEITKLAQDEKRKLGYVGAAPIANDLVNLLEQLNIILLETPIESDKITRYRLKEDWIWDRQRSERYTSKKRSAFV
jgi:hypothetical protein